MLGSKLRSWMDIVRHRKKQQRKDKPKHNCPVSKQAPILKSDKSFSSENEILDEDVKKSSNIVNSSVRYSGTNLSSPESAYSTGYSTDGTSPGAPPEYYINIRTESAKAVLVQTPKHQKSVENDYYSTLAVRVNGDCTTVSMTQDYNRCKNQQTKVALHNNLPSVPRVAEVIVNSSITSPRQRNRIRTNPWLPGSNLSPCKINPNPHSTSKVHVANNNSPHYYDNSTLRSPINKPRQRKGSTSSTCSSLSASSLNWSGNLRRKPSDSEEDCTLNEMMGKYDESYIYEKETDILSDSDPTDCDTDIDTGQDGGDEEEPLEREFDFIDNSSFLEFNMKDDRNTGHCTYYNFETHRKLSKRRTSRKSKQELPGTCRQNRRRSSSSKKRQKNDVKSENGQFDGSRSAGATPISSRKTKQHPISKLAIEDHLKRRSNSVSLTRDPVNTFDQRDKEADRKYKELIVEAEHILMSMKQSGSSPRRLPGPANKRVELLKTESAKAEMLKMKQPVDDGSKIPSSNFIRHSPKRNHITNFINSNVPVTMKKQDEIYSPGTKKKQYKQGSRSPKYKRRSRKIVESNSSDEEIQKKSLTVRNTENNAFCCPQSEPVKRKVYHQSKTVAFNLNYESICNLESRRPNERRNSTDNLRQQVLLNTITNLKRSLENQSASLKQVYNSSQNVRL
ncbi:uncharacterized protein [Onthophagus taurus]|uniref:uncharacterized protein isoform X2 n=1 Tax=Onthophagus taurus TaxID=166361 RepID=UPI000C2072FE|nr:uncharacterized protein LOC111419816 isoform X2 [Onthophagus taurus]